MADIGAQRAFDAESTDLGFASEAAVVGEWIAGTDSPWDIGMRLAVFR